jgi:hypothetical protein
LVSTVDFAVAVIEPPLATLAVRVVEAIAGAALRPTAAAVAATANSTRNG